jgi:hypothetical protein
MSLFACRRGAPSLVLLCLGLGGCGSLLGVEGDYQESGGSGGSIPQGGTGGKGVAGNGGVAGGAGFSQGGAGGKSGAGGAPAGGGGGSAGSAGEGGAGMASGGLGGEGGAGMASGGKGGEGGAGMASGGKGGKGGATLCGDKIKEGPEACDGTDFGLATCSSVVGITAAGTLQCTDECTMDTSKCAYCGDDVIEAGEQCDGATFGAATCETATLTKGATGTLSCTPTCQLDLVNCTFCGNSIREAAESCDGSDLNGATCATVLMKPATGALGCAKDCSFDTAGCAYCGDGVINGSEQCEGAKVNGLTCATVVGAGSVGALKCTASCGFDISGCTAPTGCGDGIRNGTDQCDGNDLGGQTCALALGKVGATGPLSCTKVCTLDTSPCRYCGDGSINGTEVCDGAQLGNKDCASATGNASAQGTLTCAADCASLDTSGCYFCGDGTKNGSEKCDAGDTGEATCSSALNVTGASGALGCTASCVFDTSGCQYCGDGKLNNGEACDGADFGVATCASRVGFGSTGALKCATGCGAIDTSGCSPLVTCGDGTIDPMKGEDCDGSNLGGATCASATGQATATGTLGCSNNCKFDLSGCHFCGNNIKDPGEACDGTDLLGAACGAGFTGTPQCTTGCQLDTSTCVCSSPGIVCSDGNETSCLNGKNDPLNCGDCGRSCLGGTCANSACVATQFPNTGTLYSYLVDNGSVYVAGAGASGTPFLRKEDLLGNNPSLLSSDASLAGARYLAADTNNIYVAASGTGNDHFSIVQVTKETGTVKLLASSSVGTAAPTGFCLGGSNLFLTTFDPLASKSAIWLLHPSVSAVGLLFSVDSIVGFQGAACLPTQLFFGRNDISPYAMQTEGTSPASPMDLIAGQKNISEIKLFGSTLFWSIQNISGSAGIHVMKTDGTGHKQIYSTSKAHPLSVAADSLGGYWSDTDVNSINFISLDGSKKYVAAAAMTSSPRSLQLDSSYLYFMTNPGTTQAAIFRVPR